MHYLWTCYMYEVLNCPNTINSELIPYASLLRASAIGHWSSPHCKQDIFPVLLTPSIRDHSYVPQVCWLITFLTTRFCSLWPCFLIWETKTSRFLASAKQDINLFLFLFYAGYLAVRCWTLVYQSSLRINFMSCKDLKWHQNKSSWATNARYICAQKWQLHKLHAKWAF